jgi:hypothetical protein
MVGALLLSSAIWMTMLQRHQAEQDDRLERKLDELEERLQAKPARVRK